MLDTTIKYFTNSFEIEKRKQIYELNQEWKNQISTKENIIFKDDKKAYPAFQYFCSDGFYPGYFQQKRKILFIGHESRGLGSNDGSSDRVCCDIEEWKKGNLNSTPLWKTMISIAFGIQNDGKIKFEDLPATQEIISKMIETNNFGFAQINVSKYSNDSQTGGIADYNLINRFFIDSEFNKRNFLREQIQILDPDIILGLNIWGAGPTKYWNQITTVFPKEDMKFIKNSNKTKFAELYNFNFEGKNIQFIQTYHYSAPGKSLKNDFYDPIMELLFK